MVCFVKVQSRGGSTATSAWRAGALETIRKLPLSTLGYVRKCWRLFPPLHADTNKRRQEVFRFAEAAKPLRSLAGNKARSRRPQRWQLDLSTLEAFRAFSHIHRVECLLCLL